MELNDFELKLARISGATADLHNSIKSECGERAMVTILCLTLELLCRARMAEDQCSNFTKLESLVTAKGTCIANSEWGRILYGSLAVLLIGVADDWLLQLCRKQLGASILNANLAYGGIQQLYRISLVADRVAGSYSCNNSLIKRRLSLVTYCQGRLADAIQSLNNIFTADSLDCGSSASTLLMTVYILLCANRQKTAVSLLSRNGHLFKHSPLLGALLSSLSKPPSNALAAPLLTNSVIGK